MALSLPLFAQQVQFPPAVPYIRVHGEATVSAQPDRMQMDVGVISQGSTSQTATSSAPRLDSSCWVRVAQVWAGKNWGAMHIPRVGQEVLVNDVPLKVLGVLNRKGTNIIGVDQDDILLAPWTTIKFRVSAESSPGAGSSAASTRARASLT